MDGIAFLVGIAVVILAQLILQDRRRREEHKELLDKLDRLSEK